VATKKAFATFAKLAAVLLEQCLDGDTEGAMPSA